jgi:hypothetical protein
MRRGVGMFKNAVARVFAQQGRNIRGVGGMDRFHELRRSGAVHRKYQYVDAGRRGWRHWLQLFFAAGLQRMLDQRARGNQQHRCCQYRGESDQISP